MAKTFFQPGTRVTAQFLNAIQNPAYVQGSTPASLQDGEYPAIPDEALDENGLILRTDNYLDAFRAEINSVSNIPGFVEILVDVTGGIVVDKYGYPIQVLQDQIVWLRDNGTRFVIFYDALNQDFQAENYLLYGTRGLSPLCIPIAEVDFSDIENPVLTDLRPRFNFSPPPLAQSVFGGTSTTDFVVGAGQNIQLDGVQEYRNFEVQAGGTVTCQSGYLYIKCSGTFSNFGTINVRAPRRGGSFGAGALANPGIIPVIPGAGDGAGPSVNAAAIPPLSFEQSGGFGSGGSSGYLAIGAGSTGFNGGIGGNGGGRFQVDAVGQCRNDGIINCAATNAQAPSFSSPSGLQGLMTGNAGGSGGSITLKTLTVLSINGPGSLIVSGGNGSPGTTVSSLPVHGGPGGGGGFINLHAPIGGRNYPQPISGVWNPLRFDVKGGLFGSDIGGVGWQGVSPGSSHAGQGGAANGTSTPNGTAQNGSPGLVRQFENV